MDDPTAITRVKFLRKYRMFNAGEEAGVRADVAEMLVEAGAAKLSPPSVKERAASMLDKAKRTKVMKARDTKVK